MTREGKRAGRFLMILLVALYSSVSMIALSGYGITKINMMGGILFGLNLFLLYRYEQICQKQNETLKSVKKVAIGFAALLSFLQFLGTVFLSIDVQGRGVVMGMTQIGSILGGVIFFYLVFVNLWQLLLYDWKEAMTGEKDTVSVLVKESKAFWIFLPIMLVCWMPYYLTYFPGIFGKDPLESVNMALGIQGWTNHHPILFTAFIKFFLTLFQGIFGINGALGMMTFAQMILFGSCLSYSLVWMLRKKVHYWILLGSLAFFALCPVVAVFSVYITKDVLFSGCVLLFLLKSYDLLKMADERINSVPKGIWIGYTVTAVLVIFLRNNGTFLVIGTLLVYIWKKRFFRKQLLLCLLAVIICLGIQRNVVFPMMQIEAGSFAESMSIPIQQIGQAVVDGAVITQEQETYLNQLLDLDTMGKSYHIGNTDNIKFHDDFDDELLNADKGKFLKIWAGMIPSNFGSFVKAYFIQTIGYWDIFQTDSLNGFGVVENELGIDQINVIQNLTGFSLEGVIEPLLLVCRKLPVLCYLVNMPIMMLFLLFVCLTGELQIAKKADSKEQDDKVEQMKKQSRNTWLVTLPLFIMWGTIMVATPEYCKFRYLFANYLAWPFVVFLLYNLLNHVQCDEKKMDLE